MQPLRWQLCLLLLLCASVTFVFGQDDEEVVEEGQIFEFQESSLNWVILESSNGIKFTPRNAHASCLYKGKIWVTGGKTDLYKMYNTLYSYKVADVWSSWDGGDWEQELELKGDFYAQNKDALVNFDIAPWYTRFGHTLSPIDIDNDGDEDAMIQLGGFAPDAFNDVWITTDGETWAYCGEAAWSPRGWHSAVTYNGKLYIMGGSPLNNEVWVLDSVTPYSRRAPSTRTTYLDTTYKTEWSYLGNADWSPRAGMNVFTQWYFRPEMNETLVNSTERMVFSGGFGGEIQGSSGYDGYRSRSDVWDTYDGVTWTRLTEDGFPPRAWHTTQVLYSESDPKLDIHEQSADEGLPPRMWMIGGGYIGGSTLNTKIATAVIGLTDAQFSRDGKQWTRVNYEQGNGVRRYDTFVQYFSSQEWTNTIVDSKVNYLGMWGMTSVFLNQKFILIGGDKTGAGALQSETYEAQPGLLCDIEGIICNGHGACVPPNKGCLCEGGCLGMYCESCPGDEEE